MNKIIVVGDLHIGYKKTNYKNVHRILDLIEDQKDDIDILILNGDIIDLLRCKYSNIRKNEVYNEAFLHLKNVTETVKTIYIIGNHCILAPEIVGDDLNVEYRNSFIHDNILFMHGHQFSKIQINCLLAFFTKHLSFIGQYVNDGSARVSKRLQKRIDKFSQENFYEYIVLSHYHVPHVFRNTIYCGDVTQSPSFIEITKNSIKIKRI